MITPIVKATLDCNMQCNYCYEGDNHYKNTRMSEETLANLTNKVAKHNGIHSKSTFIWHGGEPLLMGKTFFDNVIKYQKSLPEYTFKNNIQTNATLITNDFVSYFEDNNFSVGISIDGHKSLNDANRNYINDVSSYDDVMESIEEMKEAHSRKRVFMGTIAVMNRKTLENIDSFYDFFVNNKLSVRVNPIFYEGSARNTKNDLSITSNEYADAMIYMFNKWFGSDENFMPIDPLYEMLGNLIHGKARGCVFTKDCYAQFLEVTPSGDVYPCTGAATNSFCLGNINENEVSELLESSVLQYFKEKKAKSLDNCSSCDYVNICNAGCLRKSFMRRRRLDDRDYYCSAYKKIYKYLDTALTKELGNGYRERKNDYELKSDNKILKALMNYKLSTEKLDTSEWQDSQWQQWRGDWDDTKWTSHTGCY